MGKNLPSHGVLALITKFLPKQHSFSTIINSYVAINRSTSEENHAKAGRGEEVIFAAFLDLDAFIQEYREALLWVTFGNHKYHPPTEQETRQTITVLKDKIIALLTAIEAQTQ